MQEMQKKQAWSLDWEGPLEQKMKIYSSILAWEIPWTEEPGRLESTGSQGVRHDRAHIQSRQIEKSNLAR